MQTDIIKVLRKKLEWRDRNRMTLVERHRPEWTPTNQASGIDFPRATKQPWQCVCDVGNKTLQVCSCSLSHPTMLPTTWERPASWNALHKEHYGKNLRRVVSVECFNQFVGEKWINNCKLQSLIFVRSFQQQTADYKMLKLSIFAMFVIINMCCYCLGVGAQGDPCTATIHDLLWVPIWFLIISDLSTRTLWQVPWDI
jgi:hypothetical protein